MQLDIRTRVVILCCVLALAAVYGSSQDSPATPSATPPVATRPAVTIAPVTATPATPTAAPAATATPAAPAATPTATPRPARPTATPASGATPAATAVETPTPTLTATPSPEPTATTGALPLEALPRIEFVRADGTVVSLPIEVPARTEYGIGLSGRYELGERGMLFHYEEEGRRSFWMKNTHIDLDIAFIGADFVIREIFGMEAESLEIRRPDDVYRYAVEAPSGWYAANGVQVGDTARFAFVLEDYPLE
ncbi:MAG: DUF192 domain-containing protein [Chloroflexi bacterium]|nr:DUF192 domain-containing protein [Chloroflexota bacterium]